MNEQQRTEIANKVATYLMKQKVSPRSVRSMVTFIAAEAECTVAETLWIGTEMLHELHPEAENYDIDRIQEMTMELYTELAISFAMAKVAPEAITERDALALDIFPAC